MARFFLKWVLGSIFGVFFEIYFMFVRVLFIVRIVYNHFYNISQILNMDSLPATQLNQVPSLPPRTPQQSFTGQVHYYSLLAAWLLLANIGLWSQLFKHRKYSTYIHMVAMTLVAIITCMSGFMAFMYFGLADRVGLLHMGIGAGIGVGVIWQVLSGVIVWVGRGKLDGGEVAIGRMRKGHKAIGWGLFLGVTGQVLLVTQANYKSLFYLMLTSSLVSYIPFLLIKVFKSKITPNKIALPSKPHPLLQQKTYAQLQSFNSQYFIFNNKIYPLLQIQSHHPGGASLIHKINQKQVDRYLYGVESLPIGTGKQSKAHMHSEKSIRLAGLPFGQIICNNFYEDMKENNQCVVRKIKRGAREGRARSQGVDNQMHVVYVGAKFRPFLFKGYEDLSQLGKYYALTHEGITRLYSVVNCLHETNVVLMSKIFNRELEEGDCQNTLMSERVQSSNKMQKLATLENFDQFQTVPLYIKKYAKGKFTKNLFSQQIMSKDFTITQPLGFGLHLPSLPEGKVIVLTGGTGLHPFYDLIDLIFKEHHFSSNRSFSTEIGKLNPIVGLQLLSNKYQFEIYFSVKKLDEVHWIILKQMKSIEGKGIKFFGKVGNSVEKQVQMRESITSQDEQRAPFNKFEGRYEEMLPQILSNVDHVSHVYVCGPAQMSFCLERALIGLNIPKEKYTLL